MANYIKVVDQKNQFNESKAGDRILMLSSDGPDSAGDQAEVLEAMTTLGVGGTVDNTAVNAAIAENPAATRGAMEAEAGDLWLAFSFSSTFESLYISTSTDGINFHIPQISGGGRMKPSLYNPVSLRDPSVIYWNNTYWIAYTSGAFTNHTSFAIAKSADLVTWTHVADVSLAAISGIQRAWVSDWYLGDDGVPNIFIDVSTNGNTGPFTVYHLHPTNATMTTWSSPAAMSGTGLPSNIIESQVVKIGGVWHWFFKNETTKYIEHATSSTGPFSGYTMAGTGDWAGWGVEKEANFLIQRQDGTWRMYLEAYNTNTLQYSDSADLVTWTSPANCVFTNSVKLRNTSFLRCNSPQLIANVSNLLAKPSLIPSALAALQGVRISDITSISADTRSNYRALIHAANAYLNTGGLWVSYDTTKPSWLLYQGIDEDVFWIFRAPASAGSLAFAEMLKIDNTGRTIIPKLRVTTTVAPASATAAGTAGEFAWDSNYIYICTATNTWKRVGISTW